MMLSRTLILAAFVLNLAPAASLARLPAAGDPAERRARLLAEREEARAQTLAPTRGATRPNRSMARTSRVAAFDGTLAPEASVRAHGDFLGYALSPDGQLIAAIPFEKPTAIRIISLGNGELVREIDAFAWRVNALAISPDGQYLIAGGDDGTVDYEYRIKAWTFSSGALVRTFEEWHTDWIRAVDMSADGAYVVSASDDFTVMKWSFATGTRLLTLAGHTDWVRDVDITPDGQRIISASDDNTVRAWQMSDGAPVWTYTGADWIKQADITADGARVGVVYDGSTDAFILDASNGQLLHTLVGVDNWYVSTVAFTGDGLHLLAGMKNGSIRVWNTSTGVFERELSNVHTYDIERLVTGLGDDVALTGSWGLITSIELATGDVIQEIGVGSLMSGAVTPDGRTVVTGSADGRVRLWDRRTGALLRTSNEAHDDWVVALAVSPDGRHIASAGDFLLDYNVKVLRADDLSLVQEMQHEPDETINSMAFTQDGEILVTGTDWPATLAWRVADGAILHESGDHAESVEYVAITPDGMQIVSAGDANGYIAIYDIGTGTRTGTATHGDALRGIGFGEAPASSAQTIYNEDFETGAGGWTNDVAAWVTADWGLGTPTTGPGSAHSASTAWATGLHADYERDAYYSLLSPSITLPTLQQGESIRPPYGSRPTQAEHGIRSRFTMVRAAAGRAARSICRRSPVRRLLSRSTSARMT